MLCKRRSSVNSGAWLRIPTVGIFPYEWQHCHTGPSPGFSSRGAKNQKVGPHFYNTILDVCSSQGAKREMGGTDFKCSSNMRVIKSDFAALFGDHDSKNCKECFTRRVHLFWSNCVSPGQSRLSLCPNNGCCPFHQLKAWVRLTCIRI